MRGRVFLRSLVLVISSALVAGMLSVGALPMAVAAPVAVPGAGPAQRELPVAARADRGLGEDAQIPVVPPATVGAGQAVAALRGEGVRVAAGPRAAADDRRLITRSGFVLGDTSLVVYFDPDVAGVDASWTRWFASVRNVETGVVQRGGVGDREVLEAEACGLPLRYCQSLAAGQGWDLVAGQRYSVAISVIYPDGVVRESGETAPAAARATVLPASVPVEQASGCACANALTNTVSAQAVRGNAVNTAVGTYLRSEQDAAMSGYGIPFQAVRLYSSAVKGSGMFGTGWSWTYDVRVFDVEGSDRVRVRAEDGSVAEYVPDGAGGYRRPAGTTSLLARIDSGWRLTTAERRILEFDAGGRLVSVRNQRGHGVRLEYGDSGGLVSVTDAAGRVVRVRTDAAGLITRLTLPDRRSVKYRYDAGVLVGMRDARGLSWRYSYDDAGRLTGVVNPQGVRLTRVAYAAGTGRVTSVSDALGAVTRFGWDADSQEATTTDPDGVVVRDGYRDNVLLYIRDARGNTVNVRYDPALNRNLAVDAAGNQTATEHDGAGNVTQVRSADPFGYVESNSYNGHNDLTEHVDARGNSWTYSYNEFGEMVTQADPEQAEQDSGFEYTYDERGLVTTKTDPLGKVTRYEYDAAGNRTAQISPTGRRVEFSYDRTGRLVTVTDPRGTGPDVDERTRRAYTTRIGYDDEDRAIWQRSPGKKRPVRWSYDVNGAAVAVTDELGRTTRAHRDDAGRVTTMVDAAGGRTRYAYTPGGRTASVTNAIGGRMSWTYDVVGRPATETSARGNELIDDGADRDQVAAYVTTFYFDAAGNLLRSSRPYPGGGTVLVDAAFDELNRPVTQFDELGGVTRMGYNAAGSLTSMTDEAGNTLGYSYDKAGRRTGGTVDEQDSAAEITYDDAGRVTRQVTPTGGVWTWAYDDDGRVLSVTEPRGHVDGADPGAFTTRYSYDGAGNLTATTDPLGNVASAVFDANDRTISATDANGATTRLIWDEADQLVEVIAANDTRTRYTYDATGNVTAVVDANGHVRATTYDAVGQVRSRTDPLGRRSYADYDADGNVTTVQSASLKPNRVLSRRERAALTTTFQWDPIGRMTSRQLGSDGPSYSYAYDAAGRLTSTADPTGATSYSYDTTSRLTSVARGDREFTYTYDNDDNVTSRTYPDGTLVQADYDVGNRMRSLTTTRAGSAQRFDFGYDVADNLTSVTYPGGSTRETYAYDAAGRLTQVDAGSDAGYSSQYRLSLDGVGNPVQVASTRQAGAQADQSSQQVAYVYDQVGQLTDACYQATSCDRNTPFTEKYTYAHDRVGNRTQQTYTQADVGHHGHDQVTTTKYVYDAADQLQMTVTLGAEHGITTFDYDASGNQIRAGPDHFTYNLDNTLATADVDGQDTTFGYDAAGNRLYATTGQGNQAMTRSWEWDVNNALPMLAVETNTTGGAGDSPAAGVDATTSRAYTYGQFGQTLGLHTGTAGAATSAAYTHDWLGSTTAVLDAGGAAQWTYEYDPYGNPRGQDLQGGGTRISPDAPVNPLQYTGAYNDTAQTRTTGDDQDSAQVSGAGGSYHLRARDYNPDTGRFTSIDPLPATGSAYAYVANRPTVSTDPSGMAPGPIIVAPVPSRFSDGVPGAGVQVAGDDVGPDPLAAQIAAAHKAVADAESLASQIGDELMGLVADLIGITDARRCITEGDVGACVQTALNFVPWGKLFKAAKVAVKAVGVARKINDARKRIQSASKALNDLRAANKPSKPKTSQKPAREPKNGSTQ
jgi:RHS repeat-associated protein